MALGVDPDTNTVNIWSVSVWWYLYNTWATFEPTFIWMLSNTVAEKALLIKKACDQATMARIVGHAYTYDKHYIPCLKIKSIRIGKHNANRTNLLQKQLIECK